MIINHNMLASNSYRQLGINNANTAKSTEKLASGLRINKAGDDAAGLAISEKMRGQIRGLDQASRNSQDGISMVQTAEGALSETHSILQRMRELATQSASDTNTTSDRGEIQKEMNQLTSEVNRIGNTTEFNTQKLLKGSENASSIGATATTGAKAVNAVNAKQAVWDTGDLTALTNGQSGTFDFMGTSITINAATTGTGSTITGVTGNSATLDLDTTVGTEDTNIKQSAKIVTALNNMKAVAGSPLANFTFSVNANTKGILVTGSYDAGATNNAQVISTTGNVAVVNDNSIPAKASLTTAGITEVKGVAQASDVTFNKVPTEGSTFNVAGKTVGFFDSSKGTYADAAAAQKALTADYAIDVKGKNTADIASAVAALDFKNAGAGATAAAVGNKVTFTAETAGTASASNVDVTLNDAHAGTKSVLTAADAQDTDLVAKDFNMTITVGSKAFTVDTSLTGLKADLSGIQTYGSAQQDLVLNTLKNATAADGTKLSDVANISFDNVGATNQQLKLEAKAVGTDNIKTILTGTDAATAATTLGINNGEQSGTAGTAAVKDGGDTFTATFQVGANAGQSMTVEVKDMRSLALGISGDSGTGTVKAKDGQQASYVKYC